MNGEVRLEQLSLYSKGKKEKKKNTIFPIANISLTPCLMADSCIRRHWFDHWWWRNLRTVFGIGAYQHYEKFGYLQISSCNSGL